MYVINFWYNNLLYTLYSVHESTRPIHLHDKIQIITIIIFAPTNYYLFGYSILGYNIPSLALQACKYKKIKITYFLYSFS